MQNIAQKLINLNRHDDKSTLPSVIFGSVNSLSGSLRLETRIRIGMWPAISETDPEAAMGVMSILAYLLERWQAVTVYRVFAILEGEPQNYVWDMSRSQFEIEDWRIDGLNDNVGLWGTLDQDETGWHFTLEVESDLNEDEDTFTLSHTAADLSSLVNWLPEASVQVATYLELDPDQIAIPILYDTTRSRDEQQVRDLLVDLFGWELTVLFWLWEEGTEVAPVHANLLQAPGRESDDLSAWVAASATARLLLPGFADLIDTLPAVDTQLNHFHSTEITSVILARALYFAGSTREALQMLEQTQEQHPEQAAGWLALATLHRYSGDLPETINVLQQAIEHNAMSVPLLLTYARLLALMDADETPIEEFVLIDPDQYQDNLMSREAIEAYELIHQQSETPSVNSQVAQAQLLIDIAENDADLSRFWALFESVIRRDTTGDGVRSLVDNFEVIEDVEPGLALLEAAIAAAPERVDLHVSIAAALIAIDETEEALANLENARRLTDDAAVLAEIDRLTLVATDPDFEILMGEIQTRLDAGGTLTADELEYLEGVMEDAPQFTDAYLLLAWAYMAEENNALALEVLLDAQRIAPADPDILVSLARILHDTGDTETAHDYLKRGLAANPVHVPLLALMGQHLFEVDNRDSARVYLARAEAIAPNHPALLRVRRYIARILGEELVDRPQE